MAGRREDDDVTPLGVPPAAIVVGKVGRPHGIRGELRIIPESEDPSRLMDLTAVWLPAPQPEPGERAARFVVRHARVHGGATLLELDGVDDRDAAGRLTNRQAWALPEELPAPGPDEFHAHQVVGLELVSGGRVVGEIVGVASAGGRDYLEVSHEGRHVLVPTVRDWLVEMDLAAGRIVMELPAGLLDE